MWQLTFLVPARAHEMGENVFTELALAVSSFEQEALEGKPWKVEILLESRVDNAEINRRLAILADVTGIDMPTFEMTELLQKDWVDEVQKSFPAFRVGRFWVHGSHIADAPPASSIPLLVDAGMAFGSGEHATTFGCLLAIDKLARQRHFTNILDMGCGSGILALAAAKTFKTSVLAVDIDRMSVKVAAENAEINKVAQYVTALHGNGYSLSTVKNHAPYDLICSNILAKPLTKFSRHLAASLAPDGIAILSGLLAKQERMVMEAHESHGLKLIKRIALNGWHTLLIGR